MIEEQESREIHSIGAAVVAYLHGLTKALTLYETNNSAITRLLDNLHEKVQKTAMAGGEGLKIQLLAEEFFINGRLLKVDAKLYERARELVATLARFDIGEFHFEPGTTREDLDAFTAHLSTSIRSNENKIRPQGYGSLKLGRSSGQSVASFRFEPHKLALLLYGSLLDLVETLYAEHDNQRVTSLLPLKRNLQLIIDAMQEHGGMYQVLASVRDPGRRVGLSRLRVAAAIDAIGFGHYLGLARTDLMYLALGGVLGGLAKGESPAEAVRPLFHFSGLGDAAMPLVLAVHDARSTRMGKPAGVPGRMLAVSEIYQELTAAADDRHAMSPHRALASMAAGKVKGADQGASRVFLGYKGPYPLGSALRLGNGLLAVVVSLGKHDDNKKAPVVAILGPDGRLGETIDLAKRKDLRIAGAPDPGDVGLDLSRT